uniref:EB domain-containing protein n=1 Tax=Romanomermis culicivorax TaxID=13658 RepID=A0A915IMC2_ROMCU
FCPEGQIANTFCKDNYDCPENLFCSNGGCCPLSRCPNGILAINHCHDLHDCLPNQFCYNNGCCAVQSCPNGEMPSRTCDDKNPCPSSFTCQSGGCCSSSLPDCPNGDSASMPCSGPGTCPSEQFCHTDKGGYRHGCCDIPKCPNGMPAIQPCGADYSCPNGLQCLNNACCAVPTAAPQTTIALSTQQPYTQGLIYPSPTQGLVYPPPTLPNPYPTQSLVTPARYCFNCCPRLQVAVCFCNNYNICPQMTTCGVQGACCVTGDALPYYVGAKRPGDRCYADTECPGFDTGSGRCASGYCVCLPGTVSNGFTCVRYGQSPYRRYGKKRRQRNGNGKRIRREIVSHLFSNESSTNAFDDFDDILIGQDELIYWKTFGQTNCITDNECIPEMTCVNGKCEESISITLIAAFPTLVDKLNDNVCIDDEHCNKSIPFSICRPRLQGNLTFTDQTVMNKVCRCDDEHFEFKHKCWNKCPSGTISHGKGKDEKMSNEISP